VTHAEDLSLALDFVELLFNCLVTPHGHLGELAGFGLRGHHDFVVFDASVLECHSYHVAGRNPVALLLGGGELPLLHYVQWFDHNAARDLDRL